MSQNERLEASIKEIKESVNEIDERNQICRLLVTAMATMECPISMENYFECF